MTEASQQANNSQASPPSRKFISLPVPPGFSFERREENIKQYWKDKELADETARNTEFDKNITRSASVNHHKDSVPDMVGEVDNRQRKEDKMLALQTMLLSMAILSTEQGDAEVRIKRHPDNTYYDEYIKVERKEGDSDENRKRYIVAEPGTKYYIEFKLKNGFDFGDYNLINVFLFFPGRDQAISTLFINAKPEDRPKLKTHLIRKIQYANVEVDGQKLLGARFAFRNIQIDETLSNETDIMGIHPDDLATFKIKLYLWKKCTTTLSDNDYKSALLDWENECSRALFTSTKKDKLSLDPDVKIDQPKAQNIWDAKKVDLDSYKKRGISSALGFVGGSVESFMLPKKPNRYTTEYTDGCCFGTFEFHCRTSQFLEQAGIIKYPPPLHCYSWLVLSDNERKAALGELQDLSKTQWHEDQEKGKGMVLPMIGRVRAEEHPWEWRHWDRMYATERQRAFQSLQDKKKARERGIIQRQYKNMVGEIIVLDDEDEMPHSKARNRDSNDEGKENAKSNNWEVEVKHEGTQRIAANSVDAPKAVSTQVIKNEPIGNDDDDIIIVSETKNLILNPAPREKEPEYTDEGLIKEEVALERLKEDIAQEERVLKMKRQRDALQEKIDAARSEKRIKTG